MIQTVDCSVHSSPRIVSSTQQLDSSDQRCPSEVSEIAVSPTDRGRVVVSVSRTRPVVLAVATATADR